MNLLRLYARMAQWYCAALETRFPHGFPGSIPGPSVLLMHLVFTNEKTKDNNFLNLGNSFNFYFNWNNKN